MKRTQNIMLLLLVAATLGLGACSKDLEIQNPNRPSIDNFWKTAQDAQNGVNTIYSTYHRVGLSRNQFFLTIIRSDEGFSTSPNSVLINNFDVFNVTDYNLWETTTVWQDLYVGIGRANQVLDNVPAIDMDPVTKEKLLGEAKFMRGFFYYYLATLWGNVPVLLKTAVPTEYPATTKQADVYAQCIKDFSEAAAVLPATYDDANVGRATRGAAYGMLGKVYLQMHDYSQAADALKWLTEGEGKNVYDLVDNYRDNFLEATENNKESVFEFQNAVNDAENHDDDASGNPDNLNYGSSIPPFFAPRPIGFTDGQARRWCVWEFLKEKTTDGKRDPRLAASFIYDSTDERGPDYTMVYGQSFTSRGYADVPGDPIAQATTHTVYFRKLLNDATSTGEVFHSGNNYRYLRYSDILLLYAEALNGMGQTEKAYSFVNRVRHRAGLGDLPTGMDQSAFLQQLKHERLTELCGEGHRWEDLVRWDDLGPALAGRDAGFSHFTDKYKLLPIPQYERDVNTHLDQNEGW